jgi:tol-pal system protein YbgF
MPRAQTWLGIALLAGTIGCATAHPEPLTTAAEADRTINTLRAQNNSYVRQIEELQNRVFILEDRLDSLRVADQQRVTPSLPAVKTLRADPVPLPPAFDPMPTPVELPPSELAAADAPVEYAGEATRPEHGRPVLRNLRTEMPAPEPIATHAPATHEPPAHGAVSAKAPAPPPAPVAAHAAPAAKAPTPTPAPALMLARDGTEWSEPVAAEPLRVYRDALEALRAGHHAAALAGFRRFLDHYPVHDYADNAQYWIGECYYDLRQYQAATREFRAVIERYPRGNKVPDAMLKLGFTHLALGQTAEGRQVLDSLVHAFPKHEAATLATARLSEPPFGAKTNVSLGTIAPHRAGTQ